MDWPSIIDLSFSDVCSGLIGSLIGAIVATYCHQWQARETARHDFRAIILTFWNHVVCARNPDDTKTFGRPWAVAEYRDKAFAGYYRYRSLCGSRKRRELDAVWQRFCGSEKKYPDGCTDFEAGITGHKRITDMLDAI